MEKRIYASLQQIDYEVQEPELLNCLQEAPKNVLYTKIINYLSTEIASLFNVDEEVNVITSSEDSISFLMEFSSFLKELGCPHNQLMHGPISDRLSTKEDALLALDYLLGELMCARMTQEIVPSKKIELKLKETPEAFNLKKILIALRFPKPPADITPKALFEKLLPVVENQIKKTEGLLPGNPICSFGLSESQWDTLGQVQKDLHDEYLIRREMLLKRLDCTIESLQWSDKMKTKGEKIIAAYTEKRKNLKVEPEVDISHLICAREDLAIIEKTSSSNVRKNTKSNVNQVIIGQVPDRGGRTSEQAAPPPEMPSWQQRQAPQGGRDGGRGGGRGRGDFQRGGGSGYNRGGRGNHSQQNRQNSYDNQHHQQQQQQSYSNSNNLPFDSAGSYSDRSYQHRQDNYYQGQGGSNYGDQYGYQNEPKRPKTFDSFQNNRTTQADQYVQESQQNQRYRNSGRGGRGYNRGNRNNYY